MAVAFDSLGFAQRLEASGVPPQQAAGHAAAARDFIMAEQVTKADIALLATKTDLADVKLDLELKLADVKATVERLTLQMTVRLGGLMVLGIAALAAIIKLGA
jgi:hypothetical protein